MCHGPWTHALLFQHDALLPLPDRLAVVLSLPTSLLVDRGTLRRAFDSARARCATETARADESTDKEEISKEPR